ncbi:peptidyl-prolyl cis-trans isomerase FKBP43-like isoform X2 [Durio zibethinus]|uniref:peptidylprolyl isomerase n=1 Tax=Durio zibethinus TaxID=66656 RepID=A0A6P5WQK9_DURZI|nr:peptidyl-prolyl cis-trans isomerase FKBP43-like isoform X2 [Durio zibethinus]
MAFWGTEVKPGRPFSHAPLNGRLHLSQATLGMGNGAQKSIVQCNVGNKRPVFVCSLLPEKAECCQVNLEFEESDEVVFSVIGPRTVHLSGFYLPTSSHNGHNDESLLRESYGEDIAETETERTKNSEESEYGGSFIDDDDPQVLPSSPDSYAQPGSNEEMLDLKKSKNGKGRCRLRKKFQFNESENDDSFQQKDFTGAVAAMEVLDSETEDALPISSLCKAKQASNSRKADMEEKPGKETEKLNHNETKDEATMLEGSNAAIGVQPKSESSARNEEKQKHVLGVDNALMPKKKRQELTEEERFPEADHGMIGNMELEQNDQNQKLASNEENKHNDLLLASSQVGLEDKAKLKRKRKEHAKEKMLKDNAAKEDEGQKGDLNLDSGIKDVHVEDKETQKEVNDKKKKKRCKNKEDGDAMKMEPPVLSAHEKNRSVAMEGNDANDKAIQLSNGIIIEELEMGKPEGKIATLGKKVHVHYTGKLKESGQVFDSSAGKALFKFHLGGEKVPELWNVGLDGMRVGGRRRLIVPPSVSYRNEGARENVPPNSWLVFDVELVKVR